MQRWHLDKRIMFRRAKDDTWRDLPIGYWRNRHPFDCGRTRCGLCHGDKFHQDKARANHIRDAIQDWLDNGF